MNIIEELTTERNRLQRELAAVEEALQILTNDDWGQPPDVDSYDAENAPARLRNLLAGSSLETSMLIRRSLRSLEQKGRIARARKTYDWRRANNRKWA